ncbi:hypothetical protein OG563_33630 [Nocardia vinacea]|uniref:Uncharacterized protein n=1 Tax=Nocardia vinacea TaxID=96468 RepID=A0ABZ1YM16_9NOCA|nr:hypothetical protein [Nocardia vinacea]
MHAGKLGGSASDARPPTSPPATSSSPPICPSTAGPGVPIKGRRIQRIIANTTIDGDQIQLLPVFALDTSQTDSSVAAAANTAAKVSFQLTLIDTYVPIALLVMAVLPIGLAWLRRRPAVVTANPTRPQHEVAALD